LIIKILKGRSFGGLLDYLFDPQNRLPPQEIEVRGSPERQPVGDTPPSPEKLCNETDRAGPDKESTLNDSTECKQRGDKDESGKTAQEQRGELLITNMSGRSKEELREHFEALAALRPDVEVNVLHGILSMPEEDVLSPATKVQIVLRFAELKGLDRTMYAAVEHKEEHKHTEIHVISSTIDFKGRLPSDSFDYNKGEAIARQLEKEFDLKPNKSSRDTMQRAPTQGEWKQHERTGKLSRPLRLQALVNSALDREVTFTKFQQRLERRGVTLRLLVKDEGKVAGSVYEFEGKHIRGRRLGRGFTWAGLQQNWPDQQERKGRMTYEPARDNEAISRARSGAMGRGRGAGELEERERPVRSINGDGSANEGTGREAGSHRKPSHQTPAVSEEGRGAVRDNRPRRKGTTGRDGGAEQEHRGESQTVQGTGNDDGRRDQGRVPAPVPNSQGILRRHAGDKRQQRTDGQAMSGYGGDEQWSLSKGQQGRAGGVGENAGSPEVHGRRASQGDRGAGPTLHDGLQADEQVDRHRDDSDSHVRIRRGNYGRRDVVLYERARGTGDKSLEFKGAGGSKKNVGIYPETLTDALPSDGGSKTRQNSAVDQVIETLWGGSSPSEGITDQSTGVQTRKGDAKEIDNYPKQPDMTNPLMAVAREMSSSKPRASLEMVKDQTGSSEAQGPSQEKQSKHKEHGRRSGSEPSR
jgi:hypothetical protein